MNLVSIKNVSYDLDRMPPETRDQVEMLLAVEQRIIDLKRDLAIAYTARDRYLEVVEELIENHGYRAN
jgi:hypothetical protein